MSSILTRHAMLDSTRFVRAALLIAAFLGLVLAREVLANDYEAEVRSDRPIAWWRFRELAENGGVVVVDAMGSYSPSCGARFSGPCCGLDVESTSRVTSSSPSTRSWRWSLAFCSMLSPPATPITAGDL